MGDYLGIANNWVFYLCGIIVTILVTLQAVLFIRSSYREGLKRGLTREQMLKALRTGAVTGIIPSIASVVALATMVPMLGLPIPWLRQTIMGSTIYELTAAGIGAKAMEVSSLGGDGFTGPVFASAIWIMTLGSVWAVALIVFFLKPLQKKFAGITKDPGWKVVLVNAAFFGVFSIFIADPVIIGGLPLITLGAGGVFMVIFAILITKLKINWLKEFALTFSMVGAMACAAIVANII